MDGGARGASPPVSNTRLQVKRAVSTGLKSELVEQDGKSVRRRQGTPQAPSAGQQGLIASSMIRRMVRAHRPHSALQPRQR